MVFITSYLPIVLPLFVKYDAMCSTCFGSGWNKLLAWERKNAHYTGTRSDRIHNSLCGFCQGSIIDIMQYPPLQNCCFSKENIWKGNCTTPPIQLKVAQVIRRQLSVALCWMASVRCDQWRVPQIKNVYPVAALFSFERKFKSITWYLMQQVLYWQY